MITTTYEAERQIAAIMGHVLHREWAEHDWVKKRGVRMKSCANCRKVLVPGNPEVPCDYDFVPRRYFSDWNAFGELWEWMEQKKISLDILAIAYMDLFKPLSPFERGDFEHKRKICTTFLRAHGHEVKIEEET